MTEHFKEIPEHFIEKSLKIQKIKSTNVCWSLFETFCHVKHCQGSHTQTLDIQPEGAHSQAPEPSVGGGGRYTPKTSNRNIREPMKTGTSYTRTHGSKNPKKTGCSKKNAVAGENMPYVCCTLIQRCIPLYTIVDRFSPLQTVLDCFRQLQAFQNSPYAHLFNSASSMHILLQG